MTVGDTIPVQAEKSTISTSTGVHFTQVSAGGAPVAKYTLNVVAQETVTISTSETLVVTSEMRKLIVQLVPVLLGRTNTPPLFTRAPLPPLWKLDQEVLCQYQYQSRISWKKSLSK